jgi:hypothetical protein
MAHSGYHRYRIEVIQQWPDSPEKQAALASAMAALERELSYERTTLLQKSFRMAA